MQEQEIYEKLCEHLRVLDTDILTDYPFFKHCLDICIADKDNMTENNVSKIVNMEFKKWKMKERELIKMYKM